MAGQSGLDDDDEAAEIESDEDVLDDEAFGTTWAPAPTASTAVTATMGIAYFMGLIL